MCLLNTKTDDSAHSGILPSVKRIWSWVQATLCISPFSISSISPSQSPEVPGVPVIPSVGVQSPAAVLRAQGWGECWKRMNMVSSSLCSSTRSFTYCCFILMSYQFFFLPACCHASHAAGQSCFTFSTSFSLFVCCSVHPQISRANNYIARIFAMRLYFSRL